MAVGLDVLLNWVNNKLGPLTTDHAPVPDVAALAARVALDVLQIVCALPALAVVGVADTVMMTLDDTAVHGPAPSGSSVVRVNVTVPLVMDGV